MSGNVFKFLKEQFSAKCFKTFKDGKAVVFRCDEESFQKRSKILIIVYTILGMP